MRRRTEPTTSEKRALMKADRLLSLNGMDREQLLELARVLASTLMDTVNDEMVRTDGEFLYADMCDEAIEEFHADD